MALVSKYVCTKLISPLDRTIAMDKPLRRSAMLALTVPLAFPHATLLLDRGASLEARDADAAFAAPRRKFHTAPPYATAFPVTD